MAYRYHTPRNERQSEDDYYDWYLPRIGYVNVDRNKWFENHIRTPYKMIHDITNQELILSTHQSMKI